MRALVLRALLPCATALAVAISPATAAADVFGPIALLSTSPLQQFEYAHDPVISGDGRYVAFDGSIGGVSGVWRVELSSGPAGQIQSGTVEQVAGGDAELPSISQNGQYISFTTAEGRQLSNITDGLPDPLHKTGEPPNVYVRDMNIAPQQAGAFTLASALSYEYSATEPAARAAEEERYGAEAAGRTALSADGQKVAFVTTAASNLDGPKTPPLQVAVHDLETGATEIVSVAGDPATGQPLHDPQTGQPLPVPVEQQGSTVRGAVYTQGGPPAFAIPQPFELPRGVGASISADGSTVAWMGQRIGEQTLVLPAERLGPEYSEPLWRRIDGGPQAPTRRVTGGADPANPQCVAHPEESLPLAPSPSDPCQGPFATNDSPYGIWKGAGASDAVALSADGETVAFLSTAVLVSQGSDFGANPTEHPTDLYIANMQQGLSRMQALRQLTELAGGDETRVSTDARILDLAISPDGTQVAFTTKRTIFPLGSPTYVSAPAAVPGLAELFDVDLTNDTLTRVTRGYEGGPSERPHAESVGQEEQYNRADDGALSPSFDEDGGALAFSSTASNLVYGDGNTPSLKSELDGSDAFAVGRIQFGSTATPQYISSAPALSVAPEWGLGATALSLGDGNVLLYVEAPGAGTLSALASGPVKIRVARRSRDARRARHRRARSASQPAVVTRTVADADERVAIGEGGLTTLLLKLSPRYRALAGQRGGLSATANLTFTAGGHPSLHQAIAVTFARAAAPKRPFSLRRRRVTGHARTNARGRVR